MLGVSVSTLSRYSTGKTIPRGARAKNIFEKASGLINYEEIVAEFFGESLDIENGINISHDIEMVKLLSIYALKQFIGDRVEAVLTIDRQSIPIATCFASLANLGLFFADDKPIWRDGIQVSYREGAAEIRDSLWIPKSAARRGLSAIVMTTSVLSHSPVREVLNVLQVRKAHVTGLFTLVSKRNVWTTLSVPHGCRKVLVRLYS
jgi:hypothetical protein